MKIFLYHPRQKPNVIETDRWKEFYNFFSQNFLVKNNTKHYSINPYLGAVFAKSFKCTIGELLRISLSEEGDGSWIDVLAVITKQYNNRVHTSTKLAPTQASLKKIEGYVYHNLLDKREKLKQMFKIHDLIRFADIRKTFWKGDTTNWLNKLYVYTKSIIDTIPSLRMINYQNFIMELCWKRQNHLWEKLMIKWKKCELD